MASAGVSKRLSSRWIRNRGLIAVVLRERRAVPSPASGCGQAGAALSVVRLFEHRRRVNVFLREVD